MWLQRNVAVIGYAFRLPGTDTQNLWADLCAGRDLITQVDPSRWEKDGYFHPDKGHPGSSYSYAAGSVGDVSDFDATFFGISPREAACMDPQQRLLLELAWEAMENAGVLPASLRGSDCGVYIGISTSDYAYRLAEDPAAIGATVATGNTLCIAANRISYVFDLHGPSMAIDTACSSSLVAFHQACRAIVSGEIDCALAGGACLHLHPYGFLTFSQATMLSPRGRCNVFDSSADGYVRSEGGGLFLLKEYGQAVADGDPIMAVVAATAVNTDGRKSGLTVPSAAAQAALIESACRQAGLEPVDIDYFEAHGTGTPIGDPIEAKALGMALGQRRPVEMPLPVGSIKSNLGHLEAAAGAAGLVKALLSIQHRLVPATIGLTTLNPSIDFAGLNLDVVTSNRSLKADGPVRIAVNSFGFGGANGHVILESPPVPKAGSDTPETCSALLPLFVSGKDEGALRCAAVSMAGWLKKQSNQSFYDVASMSVMRRTFHPYRAVLFAYDAESAANEFAAFANGDAADTVVSGSVVSAPSGPVFLYAGNGAQWEGMGAGLLNDPVFRRAVEDVDAYFFPVAGFSLVDDLTGQNGAGRYEYTEIAQPALFAVQVGITCMLRNMGVEPIAVVGHSVGEIAAAWACGALSLADAVTVIYHRSRLQGMTKGQGVMTAVGAGLETMSGLLEEIELSSLTLAGINSTTGVTLAGTADEMGLCEKVLRHQGTPYKRLNLDYAFHSPAMDGIHDELLEVLSGIAPHGESIPFYSTVTGASLSGEMLTAEYWWQNIREPVLFAQAVEALVTTGATVFVEVSSHPILKNYVQSVLDAGNVTGCIIGTGLRNNEQPQRITQAVGQILIAGGTVDLQKLFPQPGHFVRLPNYPWQREHCWHPVTPETAGLLSRRRVHPLLGYRLRQQELTWENQLDTGLQPYLRDHGVGNATVFPAAGYVELVLAAAHQLKPSGLVDIEQLEIRSPLLLEPGTTRLVRIAVDAQDGSVTLKGREFLGETPWTTHGVARILTASAEGLGGAVPLDIPRRSPDFDRDSHECLTRQAGLQYGSAFRAIRHGWVEGMSVVAELQIPEEILVGLEDFHVHPALLDNAFQLAFQVGKLRLDHHHGQMTFIPVSVGRIRYQAGSGQPCYAVARLTGSGPHSFAADFTLYNRDKEPVVTLTQVRFRRIRLHTEGDASLTYLAYQLIASPLPDTHATSSPRIVALLERAVAEIGDETGRDPSLSDFVLQLEPLLEALCSRFLVEAFQSVADEGGVIPQNVVQQLYEMDPDSVDLVEGAVLEGLLRQESVGLLVGSDGEEAVAAQQLWQELLYQYPDCYPLIHQVGRAGLLLRDLLGNVVANSTEEYGTRSIDYHLPLRLIVGGSACNTTGRMLRKYLEEAKGELQHGKRLSLLEISEGAPYWFEFLAHVLDVAWCDYHVVSGSESSGDYVEYQRERYPSLHGYDFSQGDRPPDASVQLALVTGDFSSATSAEQALATIDSSLAPGGSALIIGRYPVRWSSLIGFDQQVWQPMPEWWQERLVQRGYLLSDRIESFPGMDSGPWQLIARKADNVTVETAEACSVEFSGGVLVIHAGQGHSDELTDVLSSVLSVHGSRCVLVNGDSDAVLQAALNQSGKIQGILIIPRWDSEDNSDTDAYLESLVACWSTVSERAMALERLGVTVPVWLITRGISTVVEGQPLTSQMSVVADSGLRAMGRTVMNECAGLDLRMICLEGDLSEPVVLALIAELERSDGEQEVVISPAGIRSVPRLLPIAQPEQHGLSQEDEAYRLGFAFPGQIRNVRWEPFHTCAPQADQLEIKVHATGLNFRDIMYTLGLLSDEAMEQGFAGATLGLECAGVVTRVGAEVSGFAPGDRVMACAPSSFGTLVLTKAEAVSPLPDGLSFSAAATIPVAFFTAWYALCHVGRVQPGERVVIHGAAGGVGLAALQIARLHGAKVFATAGTDEKRDFLRLSGVEHIYDSRSLDFADQILRDTGNVGVDLVLNSLAGEAIERNLSILKPFGRFLELGKRDFYENTRIGLRPFRNNISYFGVDADQVMLVQPELTRRLFREIMACFIRGELQPLPYTTFSANQVTDAFRYMQQSRQIGKIVVTYESGSERQRIHRDDASGMLELPPDGTWLVTGGLGGFGLRSARWLVAKGCRNLVLISRSGPTTAEAREAIHEMQEQGVRLHVAACDVIDRNALAQLLDTVAATLPPLTGVLHAAAVIDDGLLCTLTPEQMRRVLAPKILGAYHLHELTSRIKVNYFVLYSSATTLFGNPGQGNYVAANGWLEGLAQLRRAAGLPATVVLWGAIDDVGFLARNQKTKEALQGRMGGAALASAKALDALERLLLTEHSGVGILEFDWGALHRFLPSSDHARFSVLSRWYGSGGYTDEQSVCLFQLSQLSDQELKRQVVVMLQQEVGSILRLQPDKIAIERSLYDSGLDSLMGVELVAALEGRFGIQIPVMALSEGPTIVKLADRIITHVRGSDTTGNTDSLHHQIEHVARLHAVSVPQAELDVVMEKIADRMME